MANSLTGTIIAEKYRLGDASRLSASGVFYEARHVLMDKPASIFILRSGLAVDRVNVEKFFAEAKTAASINSPHVLALSDFGTDREGHVYAVYEPLSGTPLKQVIAEDGAFPVHSSVEIARQIAGALIAAHAAGQIHGNLTTDNIYLTGDNGINTKVIDFGSPNPIIAERPDAADFAYLSPGQCSGSETPNERSDVYSLGVILYEMLAGVPPFIGDRPTDVMLKHIEEMPSPLAAFRADLPEGLEPVIATALSKNPEMRQQTAQEFSDELEIVSTGLATSATAEPQNNLWKTAFVVLVGMSLLAAFMIYGTYTKQTDPTTAMQPDANGMPVQPINPATGTEEQSLASMPALTVDAIANSNMSQPPGTLAGGDGYNPWGNGGVPPPGAPYIPPGGQVVTIDPATGSPFMPTEGGVVLVPVPVNSNTNSARPTPTPRISGANANTAIPQSTPAANTTQPKPSPTPRRAPARPANRPAANTPVTGEGSTEITR